MLSRDFNVFAPDLKGFGENKEMLKPYALEDYVNDVVNYIKENNLKKPSVVAHSFGGRVVLKAILDLGHANLFDKIVFCDSAGLKPKKTFIKTSKVVLFKMLKPFIKKERLLRFYSNDYSSLNGVMRESFKKVLSEHFDEKIKNIENQPLIIFGNDDKETPLYMAHKFNKEIKNSKLVILKNAGHFCFLDSPLRFYMEVREFLLS